MVTDRFTTVFLQRLLVEVLNSPNFVVGKNDKSVSVNRPPKTTRTSPDRLVKKLVSVEREGTKSTGVDRVESRHGHQRQGSRPISPDYLRFQFSSSSSFVSKTPHPDPDVS